MREIPLLMKPDMANAIFTGRKTETRRLKGLESLNTSPEEWKLSDFGTMWTNKETKQEHRYWVEFTNIKTDELLYIPCPYGVAGDLIWCRETHYVWGERTNGKVKPDKTPWIKYEEKPEMKVRKGSGDTWGWFKIPSLFHKKKHARIWLQIEDIHIERLDSIDNISSINEGVMTLGPEFGVKHFPEYATEHKKWLDANRQTKPPLGHSPKDRYKKLWESINGEGSWNPNMYVWVITFKVLSTTGKPKKIEPLISPFMDEQSIL